MKKNEFILGSFFSLMIVLFLGYFMFNVINEDNERGFSLKNNVENLSNRVSIHYALKNVHQAENSIAESGMNYINGRENVQSDEVLVGSEGTESGSANIVTSIVTDYRGFDTLGEVTVLFISILGVSLLLLSMGAPALKEPSIVQRAGVMYLIPIIMLVGAYVFIHGHLTPGGGFPGGAVIATGFLLMLLGLSGKKRPTKLLKVLESLAGVVFVGIGFAGLMINGSFLSNFLPNGRVGSLFSAGFVMVIYIFIGIKVASELSGGLLNIYAGEEDD